ncbi:MAG: thioesterase family protein [Candidatus Omnitrophica bacterium]|nr:thioesterase family protein [Candidatus Omnitrophota bacterium]
MSLIFRMFYILISSIFRKRLGPLEDSVIKLRVLPNDLDIQGHMNNGRFLTLMDLGRIDLMVRTGFWRTARAHRWIPLVGTAMISFKRPLNLFQCYELHSRIVCWDDKWCYIEQKFVRKGRIITYAWMRGLFRGPSGNVASKDVLLKAGYHLKSPPMPRALKLWIQSERRSPAAA